VIVCLCANVSDRAIANAVREGCRTVEAITMSTGACSGCGQCRGHCELAIQSQKSFEPASHRVTFVPGYLAHS
jgi:bacterioferritin-associated ferredoxin